MYSILNLLDMYVYVVILVLCASICNNIDSVA
jgi:hypothetical protein